MYQWAACNQVSFGSMMASENTHLLQNTQASAHGIDRVPTGVNVM